MATSQKIALRWIEVLLILTTILSCMSFYFFWKQQAPANLKYKLPTEDSFKNNQFYSSQDLKISRIEAKISLHKEMLKSKETHQAETEIKLSAIKKKYPCSPDSLKSKKTDTTRVNYCNLLNQFELKRAEIKYLDSVLADLQEQLLSFTLAKADSLKIDNKRFTDAKGKIESDRSSDIFLYSFISIALIFIILFVFMGWKKGRNMFNWRRRQVFGISAGILFILFTYEVFGLYGPLGFCLLTIVLVIVLILAQKSTPQ